MKKRLFKIVGVLLVLAMALSVAACGKKDEGKSGKIRESIMINVSKAGVNDLSILIIYLGNSIENCLNLCYF